MKWAVIVLALLIPSTTAQADFGGAGASATWTFEKTGIRGNFMQYSGSAYYSNTSRGYGHSAYIHTREEK